MRRVLALVLLAFVLSGCTAGTSDDPAPPNADPNGPQQTLPPAGPSSSSTGPPTAASSNSSTTAAGATTTGAPAPQPASFGPHDDEATATHPDFPGLFVAGRLQGSGPQLRIEATANNVGERDYRVPDGTCRQPWSDVLRTADGELVQHRKPAAGCDAFGLEPFASGDFLSTALAWDGTVWDAPSASFVPAEPGAYVWQVTFDAYSGGTGAQFDDHAAMTMPFDVEVE